ncbi:hypothetical protein GF351_05420 [Candidatus Woesearchaeota archaeon]|nr:hypothetical protein [Candidatus Woesearchaeota archaeon]
MKKKKEGQEKETSGSGKHHSKEQKGCKEKGIKYKKWIFWTLIAVIVFNITFYGYILLSPGEDGKEKDSENRESLTIGIEECTAPALLWIAEEKGYFEKEGLEIRLKRYKSDSQAMQAMIDKRIDLCVVSDAVFMAESLKRYDIRILSTVASTDDGLFLLARKDRGIHDPSHLAGKRIGVQKDSSAHFFMDMFMMHNKVSRSDVEIVYMPDAQLVEALSTGNVSAGSVRHPFVSDAEEALGENLVKLYAPGIYTNTLNLVGWERMTENDPETIRGLLRALLKAEDIIRKDREEAFMTVSQQLEGNSISREFWENTDFEVSLKQSLLVALEEEARWAIHYNLTQADEVPNYLEYIYFNALEDVEPARITIIH